MTSVPIDRNPSSWQRAFSLKFFSVYYVNRLYFKMPVSQLLPHTVITDPALNSLTVLFKELR